MGLWSILKKCFEFEGAAGRGASQVNAASTPPTTPVMFSEAAVFSHRKTQCEATEPTREPEDHDEFTSVGTGRPIRRSCKQCFKESSRACSVCESPLCSACGIEAVGMVICNDCMGSARNKTIKAFEDGGSTVRRIRRI